jgi:hypothetical protein
MATISLARAAVSYSIRHSVFPQRDVAPGQQPLDPGGGSALVVSPCSVTPFGVAGSCGGGAGKRERPS